MDIRVEIWLQRGPKSNKLIWEFGLPGAIRVAVAAASAISFVRDECTRSAVG